MNKPELLMPAGNVEKLKYAITHCQAIDTDGNANEVWDDEE